jgi:predicted amidohydrolase YtcJ
MARVATAWTLARADIAPPTGTITMKQLIALLAATMWIVVANAQPAQTRVGADLIVFNARIGTSSALAVKNGKIYSVGTDSEILSLKGPDTQVINAGLKRLVPGLHDAHIHLLNEFSYNYTVRWDGVPTLQRALEMLGEQAKRTPDGQWVKVIGGWSPYQFKENRLPTQAELRRAVPNRPLIVQYAYNRAFLNELGMKAFGVGTDKFPALPGTEFEKDSRGNYTGVITGFTFTFIALEFMVPQPSAEERLNSYIYAIKDLNRFGVTSIIDAGGTAYPHGHAPLAALAKDRRLNVRFQFQDIQLPAPEGISLVDAEINAITRTAPISPGQNTDPGMAHGHEYEGAGELLRIELHDHENFDRPAVVIDPDLMRKRIAEDVTKLVLRGIPFRMHMSYDENISPFLDALEEINSKTPLNGLRWSIEHAETISPANISRVKRLGGGIALDQKMALHADAFASTYSLAKAQETPRLRMLVDSGIPLAMTTDAFRAATFNPWIGISWMVTGKSVSGSEALSVANRLTREEALALWTTGPAWFAGHEREMGRIARGNLADFALLNKDYFAIAEDEIKTISSVLTVVDGRVVFGAQEFSDLAPKLSEVIPAWSPVKYFGGYYQAK